ncbi:MAG: AlkA N-terminal domain-containing protein, partial [Gemmatimonadaceae bacterium]
MSPESVPLPLSYRTPFAWDALLAFLAARAAPATECVHDGVYSRTLSIDGHAGIARVTRSAADGHPGTPVVHLQVSASLLPVLPAVTACIRRLFDLDAEPETIASHLERGGFAPIRGEERGLRVPGAADGFELAVRAILGQQVSVKGASTLMSRVTATFGQPCDTGHPLLSRLPATAERIASSSPTVIAALGMPASRAATIHRVAVEVAERRLFIGPDADVQLLTRQLLALPGIGPWTAEYIVMRAVHSPDAFPASDLVLRRSAGNLSPVELL